MNDFAFAVVTACFLGIAACVGYVANDAARDKECSDGKPVVIKGYVYQCVKKEVK